MLYLSEEQLPLKTFVQSAGDTARIPFGRYTFPICPIAGNEKLLLQNGVSDCKSHVLLSRSEEVVSSLKFNVGLASVLNFYFLGCLMILPFAQFSSTTFYNRV